MTTAKFARTSGPIALAISLSATAISASAQEQQVERRSDRYQPRSAEAVQQTDRGVAGDTRQAERQDRVQSPRDAREPREDRQAQRRDWQDQQARQELRRDSERQIDTARQDQQARDWQRQQERNRTYANRTYDGTWQGSAPLTPRYQDTRTAYRNDGDARQWDRRWRNDNRYNWQRYRSSNRVVFSIGSYSAPYRNYSYRPVGVGSTLQQLFFSNRYQIRDPYRYRLPEVYGPYRWARYYDDVLLVDIYSGRVVDAIRNFFW